MHQEWRVQRNGTLKFRAKKFVGACNASQQAKKESNRFPPAIYASHGIFEKRAHRTAAPSQTSSQNTA